MNTVQLECFVAVAENLNFSRASEDLKITQPAVSHQIRSLEEELGVKLFRRTSKSVSLTPEGILFLPDANMILKTAMSAKERLGSRERPMPFDIGCHSQAELRLLPPVLKELCRELPALRPQLHIVPFESLFGMVENRQLHIAFGLASDSKKTVPLLQRTVFLSCRMYLRSRSSPGLFRPSDPGSPAGRSHYESSPPDFGGSAGHPRSDFRLPLLPGTLFL